MCHSRNRERDYRESITPAVKLRVQVVMDPHFREDDTVCVLRRKLDEEPA